jgi:hypothetical protein
VSVYARVKALQAVGDLEERLYQRTGQPESDAFAEFLKVMSTPTQHEDPPSGW